MSAILEAHQSVARLPASRGIRWCRDALRLWGRAPFKLWALCLASLLVEMALQLSVPWAGVALSKVIVPMLGMGILLGLDQLAHDRPMRWSCLFGAFRRRRVGQTVLVAALVGLGAFGVQQLVAWAIYGWPAVDAVLFGHAMAHRELLTPAFERIVMMSGVLPGVLLLLAPCLFLFGRLGPWRSVGRSVQAAMRNPVPFGVLVLVSLALFALMFATWWTFVLVLLFLPWSAVLPYVVWQDVRDHAAPDIPGE